MTALQSGWTPRRDLALPNELLYKVILLVISDSVHAICVSAEDTTWETNVFDTFGEVSAGFKAISSEIATRTFDIPKNAKEDNESLLHTVRKIFVYLRRLGMRLRHPSEWGGVSFETIDCSTSSLVFGYALYLSCTSLRRNSNRSPREVFESTHKVILSALGQSEALCDRVSPVEMSFRLKTSIEQEFELARHGLTLVQSFHELQEHANAMAILRPLSETDGTGPLAGLRSMIHNSLSKIEAAHEKYASAFSGQFLETELGMHELPGVQTALRSIYVLQYDEDEYDLQLRVEKIVDLWKGECPFLNKGMKCTVDATNSVLPICNS